MTTSIIVYATVKVVAWSSAQSAIPGLSRQRDDLHVAGARVDALEERWVRCYGSVFAGLET